MTIVTIDTTEKTKTWTRREQWERTDFYCPKCGEHQVWENVSENYYEDNAGCYYICQHCYHDWHMYPTEYYGKADTAIRVSLILDKED